MKQSLTSFSQWNRQHYQDIAAYDCLQPEAASAIHYLHGNGFCGATMAPLAESIGAQLSSSYSHLISDIPGHGQSQLIKPYGQPDWNQMAQDIAATITQRWTGQLIGVGHSLGGVLTLLMAAENPKLFQRIVLLDPVIFTPSVLFAQRLLRKSGWWKKTALANKVHRRRQHWSSRTEMAASLRQKHLYRDWQQQAFEYFVYHASHQQADGSVQLACDPSWEASIFASYPRRLWSLIKQIQVPVDILVADKTYPFIEKSAIKAANINPLIRISQFGKDHCFPMTNPAETVQQLIALKIIS